MRIISSPQAVAGGVRFASISAGNAFTCGVAVDGAGWCWGDINSYAPDRRGVLGNGEAGFEEHASPVPIRDPAS